MYEFAVVAAYLHSYYHSFMHALLLIISGGTNAVAAMGNSMG
jgi:hypothetical protein